jgi:uncharacterized alkaline shock family protein YloU
VTAATADRPAGAAESGGASLPAAGVRGRLVINDRVVEKVAARAVSEVDLATGAPRTVFGQTLGRAREDSPARTAARVDGGLVTVTVSMSVAWPAPVREVAAQVRRRVVQRVEEIVGLRVAEVDIDVPTLLTEHAPAPRVR